MAVWLVPILQSLPLLVGQRETVGRFVDRRNQLSVDCGKGRVGDITAPESTADNHAESVGVDVPDVGRGFDDAASNKTNSLPGQLGGAEGVGEDVVIQTGDTTQPIN